MKSIIEAYKRVSGTTSEIITESASKAYLSITESTLSPYNKDFITGNLEPMSQVDDDTFDKIRSVLGDKKFTHFPLVDHGTDADADVVEHLKNHGYDIHDYKNGLASKKVTVGNPERGIPLREKVITQSIGSVLDKTNATPEVKKAFMNDPNRQSKDTSNHHVVITATPFGVGGMSTGTNWTSCMNMNTGMNAHYVSRDIEHGTHVAYMVHHNDETAFKHGEPSKPIARIALKPFKSDDGDTIFRPEGIAYGDHNNSFRAAVSKWAVDNYPAKSGETYVKHENLYDDDGHTYYKTRTEDEIEDALRNGKDIVDKHGLNVDHHLIDHGIDFIKKNLPNQRPIQDIISGKPNKTVNVENAVESMSTIGNLTTKHVIDLHNLAKNETSNYKGLFHYMARRHGKVFSTGLMNSFLQINDNRPTDAMLMSNKIPDHVIDSLSPDRLPLVQRSKIKDHHVDKVVDSYVNDESGSAYTMDNMAWAFKEKHIDRLVDYAITKKDAAGISKIGSSEFYTKEHQQKLVDSNPRRDSHVLMRTKHATFDDYIKLSRGFDEYKNRLLWNNIASNKNLPEHEYKKLAEHFQSRSDLPRNISEKIGNHIDYDKLASMTQDDKKPYTFNDVDHSEKYVDSLYEKAKRMTAENPDTNEYHDFMYAYATAIGNHANTITNGYRRADLHPEHFNRLLTRLYDDHYEAGIDKEYFQNTRNDLKYI